MGGIETVTSIDGTPIAYELGSEGPPLFLVHGTISDHSTRGLVQPELQKHFTVYAMDRQARAENCDGDSGAGYDRRGERAKKRAVSLLHVPYQREGG